MLRPKLFPSSQLGSVPMERKIGRVGLKCISTMWSQHSCMPLSLTHCKTEVPQHDNHFERQATGLA